MQALTSTCDIDFGESAANAKANMASLAKEFGLHDYEVKFYQEAIAAYGICGNILGEGKVRSLLGRTFHGLGKYEEARTESQKALEIQMEAGDHYWAGYSCSTLADICIKMRNFRHAAGYCLQAASAMRAVGRHDEADRQERNAQI